MQFTSVEGNSLHLASFILPTIVNLLLHIGVKKMEGAFYSLQGFQNDFVKFCSFYWHKEKGVEVKGEHLPV